MAVASRNEAGAPGLAQIGVVLNGHREGPLLAQTLGSVAKARDYAAERGVTIDVHLVLDRADDATIEVAQAFSAMLATSNQVSFGNLGASRQAGLAAANNEWIAFLDGDDIISSNWLHDAFYYAKDSRSPKDTVFHTEMFVGFGNEVWFRRALRTSDPEFDPLCLIADWFFCNNLFAHRTIFERCPIEPYDHENGLGSEDWHWSCQSTEAGFARDYVPGTTYFYRVKPPSQSLGMLGGVVHKASRLFNRDVVAKLKPTGARGAAENSDWSPQPDSPRLRRLPPSFVSAQALEQADIDAQLVEVARVERSDPLRAATFPPRMHYGVAEFYRRTAPLLSDEPGKIALFWGGGAHIGGAHLLPRMVEAIRAKHPGRQIVVFSETDSLAAESLASDDVAVLDYAAARTKFAIPEHYLAMLTVRYFLQFEFSLIVNAGGAAFDEVLTRFDRAMAHRCGELIELIPFLTFDRADPALLRMTAAWPYRARFESRATCLSETTCDYFGGLTLHGAGFRYIKPLRAAIKDALRLRWSGDRERMKAAFDAVAFEDVLSAQQTAIGNGADENVGSDIAVVVLANGACPELAAVYEGVAKPSGAALHVLTTSAQRDTLAKRARGKSSSIVVHELPSWTAADVLQALSRVEATWFVIVESGVVVTSRLLEEGVELLRSQGGRGAAIPEACLTRHPGGWFLNVANQYHLNHGDGPANANFSAVGAAVISAIGVNDLAGEPSAQRVSASVFAGFAAAAAAREKKLKRAGECLALNLLGAPASPLEWVRLLPGAGERVAQAGRWP